MITKKGGGGNILYDEKMFLRFRKNMGPWQHGVFETDFIEDMYNKEHSGQTLKIRENILEFSSFEVNLKFQVCRHELYRICCSKKKLWKECGALLYLQMNNAKRI